MATIAGILLLQLAARTAMLESEALSQLRDDSTRTLRWP